MITYPIFMYGSNLCPKQLSKRALSWDSTYELAYLPNYELRFNKRRLNGTAAANVYPHLTRSVWGIIVELNDDDLWEMDGAEGHPYHYCRQPSTVHTLAGERTVEIYIAQPKYIDDTLPVSSDYVQRIISGGLTCKLPQDYLRAIEQEGLKSIHRAC